MPRKNSNHDLSLSFEAIRKGKRIKNGRSDNRKWEKTDRSNQRYAKYDALGAFDEVDGDDDE